MFFWMTSVVVVVLVNKVWRQAVHFCSVLPHIMVFILHFHCLFVCFLFCFVWLTGVSAWCGGGSEALVNTEKYEVCHVPSSTVPFYMLLCLFNIITACLICLNWLECQRGVVVEVRQQGRQILKTKKYEVRHASSTKPFHVLLYSFYISIACFFLICFIWLTGVSVWWWQWGGEHSTACNQIKVWGAQVLSTVPFLMLLCWFYIFIGCSCFCLVLFYLTDLSVRLGAELDNLVHRLLLIMEFFNFFPSGWTSSTGRVPHSQCTQRI